jgi:hypothetical protein
MELPWHDDRPQEHLGLLAREAGGGMRFTWRRQPTGRSQQLLGAAGLGPGSKEDAEDLAVCRQVAFRAAQRDPDTIAGVLAVVEELLLDEANYEFVVAFLEDVQNLVSHGQKAFWSPEEVRALLGARSAVCWSTLADFWTAVADWCNSSGLPLESVETLLTVQNEELRVLLWTMNRTLPTGEKLGLAHAVRYEKAGGTPIPGYSHVEVALRSAGQG